MIIIDKEKELSEIFDANQFAKLRKQVLVDLSRVSEQRNIFLQKHPRDRIIKALICPDKPSSEKILREISHFFYAVSPHYRRAISMLATIILNNYVIKPVGDTTSADEKIFKKEYRKLAKICRRYKFKTEIPKILTHCLIDGVFYGIEYDDTDNYFIKPVLPEVCTITSIENGVFRFSFDLNYFTQKTLIYLPQYGKEFEDAYYAYRGLKGVDGKWIIAPDGTKRWFEPRKQICIKFDEEVPWIIPPFAGIFRAIIDLDTYEELQKDKAVLDNFKLIHMKIPTDSDGVPKQSFEQAKKYFDLTANQVPEGIGVTMSPFGVDLLNLKDNSNDTNNYTKEATKDLFGNFGIAPILFGITDSVTSQSLELAIRPVESMMMKVVRQIQRVYNVKIQKMKIDNLMEVEFLEQSIYNRQKVQDAYLKGGMYGLPNKMLYAASLDLEPIDVLNLSYLEDNVLKVSIDSFNRPLVSSNTLSNGEMGDEGGRPTTDNPTDNTEKNIDNNGTYK